MNNISGIYQIQSKIKPERIYIGSAVNMRVRKNRHIFDLRNKKHCSPKLQYHYNKYGNNDLQFSLLLECDKEVLIHAEQIFLDYYKPYFNICKVAGSTLGIKGNKPSKQHIQKLIKTHTGNKYNIGRHPSKETCSMFSTLLKGNKRALGKHWNLSDETRKKMSDARKRRSSWNKGKSSWNKGLPAWNRGIPRSEETKQKIKDTKALNKIT